MKVRNSLPSHLICLGSYLVGVHEVEFWQGSETVAAAA